MVAQRHGIVADGVHGFDVGAGILQIGFGHAGINVTCVKDNERAASCLHFASDSVNQGFLCSQAVFALLVWPETAVHVVGVQQGDAVGMVGLIGLSR